MFGERSEASRKNDESGEEENVPLEEVKQTIHDSPSLTDVP